MWWKIVLFVIPGLVVIISVALIYGTRRWESATREMHIWLEGARLPITPATYDSTELNGLPAPVQRYFRAVLQDGQPMIEAISLEQSGTFNLSESGEQWKSFRSTQRVIIRRPVETSSLLPELIEMMHRAVTFPQLILRSGFYGSRNVGLGFTNRFFQRFSFCQKGSNCRRESTPGSVGISGGDSLCL